MIEKILTIPLYKKEKNYSDSLIRIADSGSCLSGGCKGAKLAGVVEK
jgi:hypothetical protein